jgi:gliding motility-associated-like protein
MNKYGYLLPLLLVITGNLFCGNKQDNDPQLKTKVNSWMKNSSKLRFMENKGQMTDLQKKPVSSLLFKASSGGMDMYITTSGLSYVFTKMDKMVIPQLDALKKSPDQGMHDENESVSIQYCRADMELVGADIRKENIVKEFESEDRVDYYLGGICPEGILNVHSYERITIKNIYPGIDWVLGIKGAKKNAGGLEYDFIVHPGADPSLIKLHYKWTDKPALQKDGSVKIKTPMGDIREGAPVVYQEETPADINVDRSDKNTNHNTNIETHYTSTGGEIGFGLGNYDRSKTLVIDPALVWATYYGGNSSGEVYSMNTDGTHVWVTGYSLGTGFPTMNPEGGAYFQGNDVGTCNVYILEFSTCGRLIWATYYGGSNYDQGNSISSDGTNVWVTGSTKSSDFPVLSLPGAGTYNQPNFKAVVAGSTNAFILQFKCANDSLIWSTYYGGSGADAGNSINSDGTNVWVTGSTNSTDFPTQPLTLSGVYNQAIPRRAGEYNAFILQFSCANSARIWATYYGGSVQDIGNSINSDGKNVWVTGKTLSSDFPIQPLAGAYNQPNLNAIGGQNANAFILEFSCVNSSRIWATYYGGSGVTFGMGPIHGDVGFSINSDGTNVWVCGATHSTDFPTQLQNGAYNQPAFVGIGAAFISQFSCANSSCIWATYYGGSNLLNGDEAFSIQSDGKNVWVCGSTGSLNFPTLSPVCGYFDKTLGSGSEEVFILQFNTSGARQWATYYGADIDNDGSYICSDGTNVFMAADVAIANVYPTDSLTGAYFEGTNTATSQVENAYIAKFNILCSGASSLGVSSDTTVCNGASATLSANGSADYTWSPATGLNTTSGSTVKATPAMTTTYSVSATGWDCVTSTSSVMVTVSPVVNVTASGSPKVICDTGNVTLTGISSGNTMTWNGVSLKNDPNPAVVSSAGVYTVTATSADGCTASSTVSVLSSTISVKVLDSTNTCQGKPEGAITIRASGTGLSYLWNNDSTSQNLSDIGAGSYTVTVTDKNGCTSTTSATLILFPPTIVKISNDTTINSGGEATLWASGGINYTWTPTGSLSNSSIYNPVADPTQTTTYTVLVKDTNHCAATDSLTVTVKDQFNCDTLSIFIPTAFSPNGDGQNDVLYVRGKQTCISQFNLQIFDRWGELVFESASLGNGWNGSFRGEPMNTAVYTYHLSVTLSNGKPFVKKGNITLLR